MRSVVAGRPGSARTKLVAEVAEFRVSPKPVPSPARSRGASLAGTPALERERLWGAGSVVQPVRTAAVRSTISRRNRSTGAFMPYSVTEEFAFEEQEYEGELPL